MRRRLLLTVVALAALPVGCTAPTSAVPPPGPVAVYVIERGWHTDIGFQKEDLVPPLSGFVVAYPDARFLTFGFGQRDYLLAPHNGVATTVAALLPSASALLLTPVGVTPQQAFGAANVAVLRVSRAAARRIQDAIWREVARDPAGAPIPLGEAHGAEGALYAGSSTYDGLFTCNTWTADTLRAGGLPVGTGVLFSGQVMDAARRIERGQAALPPS